MKTKVNEILNKSIKVLLLFYFIFFEKILKAVFKKQAFIKIK
jgi:hypothetical protein